MFFGFFDALWKTVAVTRTRIKSITYICQSCIITYKNDLLITYWLYFIRLNITLLQMPSGSRTLLCNALICFSVFNQRPFFFFCYNYFDCHHYHYYIITVTVIIVISVFFLTCFCFAFCFFHLLRSLISFYLSYLPLSIFSCLCIIYYHINVDSHCYHHLSLDQTDNKVNFNSPFHWFISSSVYLASCPTISRIF